MNNKGFVITLDAILALFVLGAMTAMMFWYLSAANYSANGDNYLKELSMDSLTVLEKSGKLASAVDENNLSEIRSFLSNLPRQMCAEILIYRAGENLPVLAAAGDCGGRGNENASVKRGFVVQSEQSQVFYAAEMNSWYVK